MADKRDSAFGNLLDTDGSDVAVVMHSPCTGLKNGLLPARISLGVMPTYRETPG